jgi:hypothetical protein
VLVEGSPRPDRDPYESNQAIPTILATRERERFHHLVPDFRMTKADWFSFAAYPLSGGFQHWTLLTPELARRLLAIERKFESALGRFMGFRIMLVVEKIAHG